MPPGLLVADATASSLQSQAATSSQKPNAKTSGQHPPQYDLLHSYEDFPKKVSGPTLWDAKEYQHDPELWTYRFNDADVAEISSAADHFIQQDKPLAEISQEDFALPSLAKKLEEIREDLLNGKGFILFKGFPVKDFGNAKSAVAYMGLGTFLGHFLSQNGRGHVLGHVKDVGDDSTQIDKVRIYRTSARQYFHTDFADLVGLLCIARAQEGGESDICSAHHVYNVLQAERPDVVRTLTEPIWYFDRKGEVSDGQEPYVRNPVLYLETSAHRPEGKRVYIKWDPYFVRSLTRFSSRGVIPPLSPAQQEAAAVLEATCARLALHMVLDVGDVQILSNAHVLHARTPFVDAAPPAPARHLMRLWLGVPAAEGGWRLPFADSGRATRGGVQVGDTPARAPLDAE